MLTVLALAGAGTVHALHAQPASEAVSAAAGIELKMEIAVTDTVAGTSRTQRSGKSGYCYIGEDRGFRSCIKGSGSFSSRRSTVELKSK